MSIKYESARIFIGPMNRKTFEAISDTFLEFLNGAPDTQEFAERKRLIRGLKITFVDKDDMDEKTAALLETLEATEVADTVTIPMPRKSPQGE